MPRGLQARTEVVHRIHRAGVVDVVGGDERGIQRAWTRRMQLLEEEIGLVRTPGKNPIHPEILGADQGAEIRPAWPLGIRWRLLRIGAYMAERAGHADPIRPHQILRQIVGGVVIEPRRIPSAGRRCVEVGIGEQPQADNSRGIAVKRANRQISAASTDGDTGISALILEGVGRAVGATPVQPQTVTLRIGRRGLREARFVDQAQIPPSAVAVEGKARMRRQDFQQIERAEC